MERERDGFVFHLFMHSLFGSPYVPWPGIKPTTLAHLSYPARETFYNFVSVVPMMPFTAKENSKPHIVCSRHVSLPLPPPSKFCSTNSQFEFFSFFFLRFYSFIFRVRGREGERGKETWMCGCLSCSPHWGPGGQPRPVP